ncbi:MAG: toast rack family protein [Anaerolineales bacterium]
MRKSFAPLALSSLLLATLACSFAFDLPSIGSSGEAGPTTTQDFNIPLPAESPVELRLGFAAGQLNIEPAEQQALVAGSATYNVEQLAPAISTRGGMIQMTTGEVNNLNDLDFDFSLNQRTNRWDLTLAAEPMSLQIDGGAFQGSLELGGLAIEDLKISSGAADLSLSFSEPNLASMRTFEFNTGASSVNLTGLANAGFEQMQFQGGAGDFTLDFSGDLRAAADVRVKAALSSIKLVIPEGINAEIQLEGGLANVQAPSGFSSSGRTYTQSGSGPQLTVHVQLGAGDLQIQRP